MMPSNREELIVDQDNGPTIKKFQRDNKGKMIFAYFMCMGGSYTNSVITPVLFIECTFLCQKRCIMAWNNVL